MLPYKQSPDYEAIGIREDNLLLKLWLHPQATLSYILTYCPTKYVTPLLVLGGIARAIDRLQQQGARHLAVDAALTLATIMGGLTGWITYYFYAWGLELAGNWLGGRASATALRTVLAWALVPTCLTLVTTALGYAVQGDSYFQNEDLDIERGEGLVLLLLGVIDLVLAGWAVVILVRGIMLVQQFSVVRAVVNALVPGLAVLVLVASFMGLYSLLAAASS